MKIVSQAESPKATVAMDNLVPELGPNHLKPYTSEKISLTHR